MSANTNVSPLTIFPLSSKDKTASLGAPVSVAASGTLSTGWFDAQGLTWLYAIAKMGVGDGTTALKFEQSTVAAGSNPKDCTGALASTAAFGATDDGAAYTMEGIAEQCMDVAGGFRYVRATLTVTGGSGTILCLVAGGGPAPYES